MEDNSGFCLECSHKHRGIALCRGGQYVKKNLEKDQRLVRFNIGVYALWR
jgi:hypothetical protein